jgi:hypothetical protein
VSALDARKPISHSFLLNREYHGQDNTNSSGFNYRIKRVFIIYTITLLEFFCYKPSFVSI